MAATTTLPAVEHRRFAPGRILLVTKFHPPDVRTETVLRDKLVERLRAGEGCRLTLLAAPAGYGKSTLLAEWRAAEAGRRPVAWLSVDEADDDPVVFWSYLVEATRRELPGFGEDAAAALRSPGVPIREVVLPLLVNELADGPPVVVILDDFHRIASRELHDDVWWLIERAPGSLQLVLSTRGTPPYPLATLRARGQIVELGQRDLAFSGQEAVTFLSANLGRFAPGDARVLATRTEGWPAGLYLAALSLGDGEDGHSLALAFDASNRHVSDFLAPVVLHTQAQDVQDFLLRTSVLERLAAPLCDHVLEQEGSARILRTLERSNLFLVELDDRREWFRYHHLFADLLRRELERRRSGAAAALRRRAYEWHRAAGNTDEAIDLALAAGMHEETGALIAAHWVDYVDAGRGATLLGWLDSLPEAAVAKRPAVLLVRAWVLTLAARHAEADRVLAAAERLPDADAGPLPDGLSSVSATVALIRGLFAPRGVGAMLASARRAAELEPDPASPWRAVVCWAVGQALYWSGDDKSAQPWLEEASRQAGPYRRWIVAGLSRALLARIAAARGDLPEAERQARKAVEVIERRGLREAPQIAAVYTALGIVLAQQGRLADALDPLEHGVRLQRTWGSELHLGSGLVALAPVVGAHGERERERALVAEARAIVERHPDPGILAGLLEATERPVAPPRLRRRGDPDLSEREITVLRLLTSGLTRREIGQELFVSYHTIHSHTKAIYRKLGVSTRAEAVARARELGVI
jgi:LuxR family maltose regulon positive regulatory protein